VVWSMNRSVPVRAQNGSRKVRATVLGHANPWPRLYTRDSRILGTTG